MIGEPLPPPTEEQEACIQAASRPANGSLIIEAYAGTAKSTTLEMLAPRIQDPVLALAFNKRIAQALSGRLPLNFKTQTLNSLGHAAWTRRPGMPSLHLDDRKEAVLLSELLKETSFRLDEAAYLGTRDLIRVGMQRGLLPSSSEVRSDLEGLPADEPSWWHELAEELAVPTDEREVCIDLAREVIRRDITLALRGEISFNDQVFCPTVLGGLWPKFPVIMGDEVQDWSFLNHLMVRRALRPGGRLIIVGDPLQSIYAWRGADASSMENVRALAPRWVSLPLTMTFRCPREVVARQRFHARGFRAAPSVRNGQILTLGAAPGSGEEREWIWSDLETLRPPGGSLAVLSRNNAPLMSLAFKLLRGGIGPHILGRDFGKGLVALSRKIASEDSSSQAMFFGLLEDWRASELERAGEKETLVDSIQDRAECLRATAEQVSDVGSLRALLVQLFAREDSRIVLSTIHRAKGLEWDCVLHLDPWRIGRRTKGEEALRQERNLLYVAETRTRDVLALGNLKGLRAI